jgi:beta-glucosidase
VTARTPVATARVADLLAAMTLEEKVAQLVGYWVDHGGEVVAPMAGEMATSGRLTDATKDGLGHLTRVYGTRPVEPDERAAWLWAEQRRLREETRLGIPALVHEECLTGLAAYRAATYPTPLAWGASFDPALVEETAAAIGGSMRELGIHQGLAPVLDVIRDPRWGRVDECIGEDPYLVGSVGTAYVRGLQSAGVDATLKHFLGYSASRAGRNHAPVEAGPRAIADIFLPPFEMALLDGGARSVMNAYVEVDGVPLASHEGYLTDLLRGELGFDGVVVADYFAVAFLQIMHAVAADRGEAAALALRAGIDIELPGADAYPELVRLVREGVVEEALLDRAVRRALEQKAALGLLDETFDEPPTGVDLDSPEHRTLALRLAEESVVLLSNDGVLPLAAGASVAVIGPNADRAAAMMGCYSFVNHVLAHHPDLPMGIEVPTLLEALHAELPGADVTFARGCDVEGDDESGIAEAVALAAAADVAVLVLGDQAGLFGRGTVGEGNDSESLDLPGVQRRLAEAVRATGTPVVMVLLTGRPYAIGWALDGEAPLGAVVQAFFPGEEGGPALAGVLSGRVNPSGRLPVTMPRSAGAQPYSYLHPILGGASEVTDTDPTPVLPFGHGLAYTTWRHTGLAVEPQVLAEVRVANTGDRAGTDVVQLYARDAVASVTRPVAQLVAYRRVHLEPGEEALVRFVVPGARLALTDRALRRVVEPGDVELWVGPSCVDKETSATVRLVGDVHEVTTADPRLSTSQELRRGPAEASAEVPAPQPATNHEESHA